MSDESREFKIRITGDASSLVGAARKSAQSLDEVGGAAKKEGDAHVESARKTEKNTIEHRHLREIALSLNQIFPGLGSVMFAAFSPVGAAVLVAVEALGYFRQKLREVNEEYQKLEAEAATPVLHTMGAQREAVVSTADGLEKLRERLEDARRGEQGLKEAMTQTLLVMKEGATEQQALSDTEGKAALELLDQQHQQGIISEQDYNDTRLKLQQEFIEKKRKLQADEEMLEILAERRQVEKAEMQQDELTKAAETAEKNKEGALTRLGSMRTRAEVQADKDKTAAALKAWETKYGPETRAGGKLKSDFEAMGTGKTFAQGFDWMQQNAKAGGEYHTDWWQRYQEWDQLTRAANAANAEWQKQPGEQARRQVAADRATHEADRAATQAEQNQDFITHGQRDMEQRRGAYSIHQAGVSQVQAREHAALDQLVHQVTSASERRMMVLEALTAQLRALGQHDAKIENELARLKAQMRQTSNNPT